MPCSFVHTLVCLSPDCATLFCFGCPFVVVIAHGLPFSPLTFLSGSASSHCFQQAPIIVLTKVELVGGNVTSAFFHSHVTSFLPPSCYTLLISCAYHTYLISLSTILSTHGALHAKAIIVIMFLMTTHVCDKSL